MLYKRWLYHKEASDSSVLYIPNVNINKGCRRWRHDTFCQRYCLEPDVRVAGSQESNETKGAFLWEVPDHDF